MEHPSSLIRGERGWSLWGRCIALGVTGSAAVYRSVDLARLLMRWGARVRVVMTSSAAELVSPSLFEWATGEKPVAARVGGGIEHIALARGCDALLVAPATLETMAEIAGLHASNPVSALAQEMLGLGKPVLIVPAMHEGMWRRASRLLGELEEAGAGVLLPRLESGQAKYPDTMLIAWWAEARILRGRDLEGYTILVTAGPTREHIDEVRVITNPSTGLMGVSVALEAAWRGARVRLVHGPLCCCQWRGWRQYLEAVEQVEATEEMLDASLRLARGVNATIHAAAASDYRPRGSAAGKIPSTRGPLTIELEPTPKVVEAVVSQEPSALHVGFTAEPLLGEELLTRAREKLERYRLDLIVANSTREPGAAFASETNHVYMLDWRGRVSEARGHKREVARRILDEALQLLERGDLNPARRRR